MSIHHSSNWNTPNVSRETFCVFAVSYFLIKKADSQYNICKSFAFIYTSKETVQIALKLLRIKLYKIAYTNQSKL